MKYLVTLAALILAACASTAMASGPYVGASGGITLFHYSDVSYEAGPGNYLFESSGTYRTSYAPGFAFNVSGGYMFDNGIRVEGEFGYKRAELTGKEAIVTTVNSVDLGYSRILFSDADLAVKSFMVNGFYNFKTHLPVTPFLGAGVGALLGTYTAGGEDISDVVAGYQLIAGASYSINDRLNLDLSYRFEGAVYDFDMLPYKISYHSSNLLLGVRYGF